MWGKKKMKKHIKVIAVLFIVAIGLVLSGCNSEKSKTKSDTFVLTITHRVANVIDDG